MNEGPLKIQVLPINQKIGTFYIGKILPKDLKYISRENMSRYSNAEKGIQRNLSRSRQNEIRKYLLEDADATFPNTIIVAIDSGVSDESESVYNLSNENGVQFLNIEYKSDVAIILDGQHRLSGFEDTNEDFELPVAFFLDPSLSVQAKIFATINSKQVKVNNDLVYELFGISDPRSTQKTAYSIVKHLNEDQDSPWRGKIKTLNDRSGYIAQGSFAKYIDTELIAEGKVLREMYEKERDVDILAILKNFFDALGKEFKDIWNIDDKTNVLQKTTGFVGSMMFFKELVEKAKETKVPLKREYFANALKGASTKIPVLKSEVYESGAKGQTNFFNDLLDNYHHNN